MFLTTYARHTLNEELVMAKVQPVRDIKLKVKLPQAEIGFK